MTLTPRLPIPILILIPILIPILILITALTPACNKSPKPTPSAKKLNIYLLPKQKGLAYFETCAGGAQEAATELGDVNLIYDGPVTGDATEAARLIRQWTQKKADVIAVSVNDPAVLADAMKEARNKNTHVITWDADAPPDSRELFVNQATPQQIAEALVDTLAHDINPDHPADAAGEVAIISATPTAANQNEWMKFMSARLPNYPHLHLIATEYCNEDSTKAKQIAQDLIKAHPNLKGIWAISSTAFPGAADGIQQSNMAGQIQITGLSTPNDMKKFVHAGTVKSVILWNTLDLGYLTLYAAEALATNKYHPGDKLLHAGRLGDKQVINNQVLLGQIQIFTKDNIDQFNF